MARPVRGSFAAGEQAVTNDDKPVIERILGHLGLPTTGPPTASARLPAPAKASLRQDDVPELQQSLR